MEMLRLRKKQILVVVLLGLSFFLLMDLNARLNLMFRSTKTYDEMKTSIYQLESTKQVLLTQIAIATSDVVVRPFANDDRHWYQDNDIPVFPVADPKATPPSYVKPLPTPMVVEHWQKWWALFFGD
jgi:hypothetical protein